MIISLLCPSTVTPLLQGSNFIRLCSILLFKATDFGLFLSQLFIQLCALFSEFVYLYMLQFIERVFHLALKCIRISHVFFARSNKRPQRDYYYQQQWLSEIGYQRFCFIRNICMTVQIPYVVLCPSPVLKLWQGSDWNAKCLWFYLIMLLT